MGPHGLAPVISLVEVCVYPGGQQGLTPAKRKMFLPPRRLPGVKTPPQDAVDAMWVPMHGCIGS